jgi:hypothetical protein
MTARKDGHFNVPQPVSQGQAVMLLSTEGSTHLNLKF